MSVSAVYKAQDVLVAHQRLDIGNCRCGWGANAGNLGESHSVHVVVEMQAAGLTIEWREDME